MAMVLMMGAGIASAATEEYRILYKPFDGYVGDVMPMGEGDTMQMFYLHDSRNGAPTFHPFYRISTQDFVNYTDWREAIPTTTTFDHDCALGTGSVLKVGDTYHAFYTGHNYLFPQQGKAREVIRHAISTDNMKTFVKIEEDTFGAPEGYGRDDFRDPFLFYNEADDNYWLLVTATRDGNGVVARFCSKDLSSWELMDPLFTLKGNITECTDLFKIGDWWYLIYSSGWLTHYRMSKTLDGNWIEPAEDTFDSHAYYAAKTGVMNGQRYLCGWIATRDGYTDTGNWGWAGNLCVHQLMQREDGTLYIVIPESVRKAFTEETETLNATLRMGKAICEKDRITLTGDKDGAWITLGTLPQRALISTDVTLTDTARAAGFTFGSVDKNRALAVELSAKFNLLRYDNCTVARTRYQAEKSYISRELRIEYGKPVHLDILIENDLAVFYLEGREALSVRIYRMPGEEWGLYAADGTAVFDHLTVRTTAE